MTDRLHKTKGIVLRTVKYGETSLIVTVFTELLGLQSYLVNGVRTSTKQGAGKANLFQPASILDLVAYHNELRQLQRIKEFRWSIIFSKIFSDVKKNAVALYMVELLTKCLKQPEASPDLYHFVEDALLQLDTCEDAVTANYPLFFGLHLPVFFGFRISSPPHMTEESENYFLDLEEGEFVTEHPRHPNFLEGKQVFVAAEILRAQHPRETADIKLNHEFRRNMLFALEKFYVFHVHEFGTMKTLPVLKEILS